MQGAVMQTVDLVWWFPLLSRASVEQHDGNVQQDCNRGSEHGLTLSDVKAILLTAWLSEQADHGQAISLLINSVNQLMLLYSLLVW